MTELLINMASPLIVNVLMAALTALIAWVTNAAVKFLNQKNVDSQTTSAIASVIDIIGTVVDDLGETVMKKAVKALADGKITKKEWDGIRGSIKGKALKQIKSQITPAVANSAELVVGDLHEYISSKIEQYIGEKKLIEKKIDTNKTEVVIKPVAVETAKETPAEIISEPCLEKKDEPGANKSVE